MAHDIGQPGPPDARTLQLRDQTVAEYVLWPDADRTLSPRPYLHPVRTLAGTVVTEAFPADHRWHLGASLAVQDVSGTNLWGGRTYLRGSGYTWRDDHGHIAHRRFLAHAGDRLVQELAWLDRGGQVLLTEQRALAAHALDVDFAWALRIGYTLTAPDGRDITLGSPATNGRPGGAGYGGFFWRAPRGDRPPRVFTAASANEATVNGSAASWVALADPAVAFTLVFTGLAAADRWFVRARQYPGVGVASAFETPCVIPGGGSMTRSHTVVIADGVLSPRRAADLVEVAHGSFAPLPSMST